MPENMKSCQIDDLLFVSGQHPIKYRLTGSKVIDPKNSEKSDTDILCLVSDISEFVEVMEWEGWSCELDDEALDFVSLRGEEDVNLIVTDSPEFYAKFELATQVAQELQLDSREKRVCLFQSILYGNFRSLTECGRGETQERYR